MLPIALFNAIFSLLQESSDYVFNSMVEKGIRIFILQVLYTWSTESYEAR